MLFTSLGLSYLQFRFVALSEEYYEVKLVEDFIVKTSPLQCSSNKEPILGTCKPASASSFCKERIALYSLSKDEIASDENPCSFKSRLSTPILHEYMRPAGSCGDQNSADKLSI